jgi:shikimate kinase
MEDEPVEATACGTGIIADAYGKGAAFAIDLKAKVTARILENGKGVKAKDKTAKEIAKKVMGLFGHIYGLDIGVENEIPENGGFGDREAVAVATALAVTGALARKHGSINEFKIDLYLKDQFMVVEEKLVDKKGLIYLCLETGMRLDRIYASFYGGFAVADSRKGEMLRRGEMETLKALILIPKNAKREGEKPGTFDNELEIVFNEALRGNLYTAMNMHSILYDRKMTGRILSAGALAVSRAVEGGVIVLVRDEKKVKKIGKVLGDKVLIRDVMNNQARIQIKPKRIYKINEFMELKGKQEYHWL